MRLLSLLLVVAVCGAGCAPSRVTAREASQPSDATAATQPDGTGLVGSSSATAQPRPSLNAAVHRRARAALTEAGVTDLRITPGYETEVNTAIEGTWRRLPVQAYVVPTSELVAHSGEGSTIERHPAIGGRPVEVVRGQHSSIRFLRFELGSDTWMLASMERSRAESDESRSVELVAALLAQG